eukprot:367753-Pyramimonas_sp.AAC.1
MLLLHSVSNLLSARRRHRPPRRLARATCKNLFAWRPMLDASSPSTTADSHAALDMNWLRDL